MKQQSKSISKTSVVRFAVRVQPGAKSNKIVGSVGEGAQAVLRVRLRAQAVEGQANSGLTEFIAETLGVRPRQVTLILGEHSREKVIQVEGISIDELTFPFR